MERKWLSAFFAAAVCLADSRVAFTTNGIERAGVTMITPADSRFIPALTQIARNPRSSIPDLVTSSPYVVIIENVSQSEIARLSIRYDVQFPDRPSVTWVHTLILSDLNGLPGLRPSQSILAFAGIVDAGPGYATATAETLSSQISLLAKANTISVSLDSVLFHDGRFLGPDRNGESERYLAQQAAVKEMLSELRRLAADGPSTVSYLYRLRDGAPRPSLGVSVADRSRDRRFHFESMQTRLAGFVAFKGFSSQQAVDYLSSASQRMPDLR